jgi:hypothetical protein
MYRKVTFLFITLVMVSLMITPIGKANAQVETQVSAPACPPFDPALSHDKNFLKSLPPECAKVRRTLVQNAGSQAGAQDVLPTAGDAGSKYKSELSGLAGNYKLYLPLVMVSRGINGRVTNQGNPINSIPIQLWLNNGGSSWSSMGYAYTQADGFYEFTSAPSLGSGQFYQIEYYNTTSPTYVNVCYKNLSSYTAGNIAAGGSFDIANIPQVSPANGANVALPYTFQWTPRAGVPTDNYSLEFWNSTNGWSSPTLGYVSQYTLTSLPTNLSRGTIYYWDVAAIGADGSVCWSYDQNRKVIFP